MCVCGECVIFLRYVSMDTRMMCLVSVVLCAQFLLFISFFPRFIIDISNWFI